MPNASAQSVIILRVDDDQTTNPMPDGLSWGAAFPNLQGALDDARARLATPGLGDDVAQIWVAQGVYKPTTNPTDRTASFELVPEAFVYGGFVGNEPDFISRAGDYNQTILSGDIDGDPRNQAVDSFHVVRIEGAGRFLLDGFQVMLGSATGTNLPAYEAVGGGVLVLNASTERVRITNCLLQACVGGAGGGIGVANSHDVGISRCNFVACLAFVPDPDGGATPPSGVGAGLAVFGTDMAYVYNSAFIHNRASYGGAVYVRPYANPGTGEPSEAYQTRFVNCLMADNTAIAGGGAYVLGGGGSAVFDFCTIANNVSISVGDDPPPTYSYGGGGIYTAQGSRIDVRSTIIWGNQDQNQASPGSESIGGGGVPTGSAPVIAVTYSDVQLSTGTWAGTGNINANPVFVNAGMGNYRIQPNSPCIDIADDTVIHTIVAAPQYGPGAGTSARDRSLGDFLDVDEDGVTNEFLPLDLDFLERERDLSTVPNAGRDFAIVNLVADMGCYEQPLMIP